MLKAVPDGYPGDGFRQEGRGGDAPELGLRGLRDLRRRVPGAAADVCATAYRNYRKRRISQTDTPIPLMPLPDFFIGAHAKIMDWELATADKGRFHAYFPSVTLKMPN